MSTKTKYGNYPLKLSKIDVHDVMKQTCIYERCKFTCSKRP